MANSFTTAKGPDGLNVLERMFGKNYDYTGHIKTPTEMGMSGDGNFTALADDIGGLLGYVDLLIGGQCSIGTCASKRLNNGGTYGKPLGNQFFLDTVVKCNDIKTGQDVTRSLYVNNIPDGQIPLISNMSGVTFDDFKGIMPGIMSNIAQIHPMQILMSFVSGSSPACQLVTMPTMNENDEPARDSRYITNSDISVMPASWFSGGVPPKSSYDLREPNAKKKETFRPMKAPEDNLKGTPLNIDYSKMPNDVVIRFYYSMLGLLGLYLLLRLTLRKK
jgi:hypothetical protein